MSNNLIMKMKLLKANTGDYAESLEDFKPEYTPVKVWSLLQFYRLQGKKTTMILDNFETAEDIKYCVFSPKENRYYFKTYPEDITLWQIMFYKVNEDNDSYDAFVNDLRRKVESGHVHILFTSEQIEEMSSMLIRLYKSHFNNEGKIPYNIYLQLMEQSLIREKYFDDGKGLTGYRTALKIMDDKIKVIWGKCYKN